MYIQTNKMKNNLTIQFNAMFGNHLIGDSKKTGKPYNIITLSDGFKETVFSTKLSKEETQHLSYSDQVQVTMTYNPFSGRTELTAVV
jgi:hypothetical protein